MSAAGKGWKTGYTSVAVFVGWIVCVVLFATLLPDSPTLVSLPTLALIGYVSWRTYKHTQIKRHHDLPRDGR